MSTPVSPSNPPDPAIVCEPNLYYEVTAGCPNTSCPKYNVVYDVKDVWSNADGNPRMVCGICNTSDIVLTATIEDPQPIFD